MTGLGERHSGESMRRLQNRIKNKAPVGCLLVQRRIAVGFVYPDPEMPSGSILSVHGCLPPVKEGSGSALPMVLTGSWCVESMVGWVPSAPILMVAG